SEINDFIEEIKSKYENASIIEKIRKTPVQIGFRKINMQNSDISLKSKPSIRSETFPISNSNDPNIDGYFPINLTGLPSKSIKAKKEEKSKPIVSKSQTSVKNNNNKYYKEEYEKITNSRLWKVIKPIRLISDYFKKTK